jgi:hypothetical protein
MLDSAHKAPQLQLTHKGLTPLDSSSVSSAEAASTERHSARILAHDLRQPALLVLRGRCQRAAPRGAAAAASLARTAAAARALTGRREGAAR